MEPLENMPLVSIVMINWNRKDILQHVLTSTSMQTYSRFEIILCDNHSTDGAPDMVEQQFPDVKLIRLGQNLGITGYNLALEQSDGEIIVILDNDSFLEDEGIAKIVNKFKANPHLGALGCKVYNHYSGRIHHWHPSVREENLPAEGVDSPLFNGCAAAVTRQVLNQVGFYPDEFFLYENERDLCTRIINAGYDVKYFTDISGYHMAAGETRRNERIIYYARRNRIWYFWKYMPVSIALWKTLVVVGKSLTDVAASGKVRIHLKPVVHALCGMPKILRKRTPVNRSIVSKVLY